MTFDNFSFTTHSLWSDFISQNLPLPRITEPNFIYLTPNSIDNNIVYINTPESGALMAHKIYDSQIMTHRSE